MNAQKIRQQVAKLFASDRPKWEKWEYLTEVVQHARSLTDSLLSEGHDFDHLDDAIAIAIYEDRPQTAWPRRTGVLWLAECCRKTQKELASQNKTLLRLIRGYRAKAAVSLTGPINGSKCVPITWKG